jgi:hypothetical protein
LTVSDESITTIPSPNLENKRSRNLMTSRKFGTRLAGGATVAATVLAGLLALTTGVAEAGVSVPAYPTAGVYPNWLTAGTGTPGTQAASNIIRGAGSDTTLFMMQQIGDLYSQAGLYGCQLIGSGTGQNADCDNTTGTSPNFSNVATTDTIDNFDRTEVLQGINNIGSGNGQAQLCGTQPTPQNVDYARSSKPAGSIAGCNMVQLGYAKDSVPALDFQSVDPAAVGSPSFYKTQTFNGVAFPSTGIGPVAAGWLPGDATNCVAAGEGLEGTPCSGTPFNDVDNTGGSSSIAYRLWCASTSSTPARITDWGQLTNLSASGPGNGGTAKTVGNGAPIGVPIRIIGINLGSGTVSTFASYANSGVSGGLCGTNPPLTDGNAASGANPLTNNGTTGNLEISVENNASQIGDFAAADFPNDPADQAVELATALYFESYGVNQSNPNAGSESLEPGTGTVPGGVPLSYTGTLLNENGVAPSIGNERTNTYPTARTLFNIYNSAAIRSSTAGFLDWICDSNTAFAKKTDLTTGVNFDNEITNVINNTFEFSRLNDNTTELAASKITPADGISAPNSSCDATLGVTGNGTTTVTMTTGNVPSPAAFAVGQSVKGTAVPSGTTVQSVGTNTITFNNVIPSGATTVYFPGMAPVLAVTSPNS